MNRPLLAGLLVLIVGSVGPAATDKPPRLDHLFPSGAARGTTVEVTAVGEFERWPVRAWSSSEGITVKAEAEKGKLSITVGPSVPPGAYWVRLADDGGVSLPRPFLVGRLPEILESEPNDEPNQAQKVEGPERSVNGRLAKNGDVDVYRVHLTRGQTLVASMDANRRVGSPMDGVLQVASSDGFVLAHNDDDHDRDPQIVFEAPLEADYLVRVFAFPFVQDSSIRFSGGSTFIYRLTLTTRAVVDHVFPMAVSPDGPSQVEAVGWNLGDAPRVFKLDRPFDESGSRLLLMDHSSGLEAMVRVVPFASIVEAEPNDGAHPQAVGLPVAISGHLDPAGDRDSYTFAGLKGEALIFRLESRSIGQPVDAVLRVSDASGGSVVEVDDAKKGFDPEVRFNVPSDGTYRITVRDLNDQGGPRQAYLLILERPQPDFALTLKTDHFGVIPGQTTEIPVTVDRREGFAEPVEIRLETHHDGVICRPVVSVGKSSTATLRLAACDCVRPGPIRVVGTTAGGLRRVATTAISGLNLPIDWSWLTVEKPVPKPVPKPVEPAK